MAQLSASFGVDFSAFYDAVTKANVYLTQFEGNAGKVSKELNRTANSFSGVQIKQDATIMAQAIEKVGGAAKLTAAEQAKVNVVVSEAIAKYKALGEVAPQTLTDLAAATARANTETEKLPSHLAAGGAAAGTTASKYGELAGGLRTADKALGQMGVSIGSTINTVEELGQASGKTIGQIGGVGTAALALSAGLAGWKVGRMIAEFFGLDEAIANTTARLLGFGDVAAETAGAKADVLARATANAGRTITDFSEAVRINAEAARAHVESFNNSTSRVEQWEAAIAKVRNAGHLKALEADMKAGNATNAELEKQYGISARALEYFGRQTAEVDAKQKTLTDSAKQHADAIANLRQKMFGGDAINAARDYLDALGPVVNLHKLSKEETERLNKALGDALDAYHRLGKTAPQAMKDVYTATTTGSAEARKALEAERKQVADTMEVYRQLGRVQLERTGTTTQKAIDDINRWYENEKNKTELGTLAYESHMVALKALYDEKMSGIMVNYDQLRGKSKAYAEDEAKRAEATFAYMVKQVGTLNEYGAADLEAARASAQAARDRVTGWNQTADAALDAGAAAAAASDAAAEGAKQASTEVRALAASYTVVTASAEQWRAKAMQLNDDAARTEMAGGTSLTGWQFQDVENLRKSADNASRSAAYQQSLDARMGLGVPWGNTTAGAFNVTVNAMQGINGDQIAQELVDGMRRRGMSPGA